MTSQPDYGDRQPASANNAARAGPLAVTTAELSSQALAHAAQQTYQRLLVDVQTMLRTDHVMLTLLDTAQGELVIVATLPVQHTHGSHIALNQGVAGWVAAHHQPACIADVARDARMVAAEGARQGSLLCVPLAADNILLGTLSVQRDGGDPFDQRALAMLEVLARYAAVTIAQARQAQVAQARARHLTMLVEAARVISSLMAPGEVFANIVAGIAQLIDYEDALIFAHDAGSGELQVVAGRSRRGIDLRAARVSMSDATSLSVRVAQQRRPSLYAPESGATPTGRITETFLGGEDVALLCVPLVAKDALRGVVTLARRRPFDPGELRAMTDLAPLIATALDNVALYGAVLADQERLAAIFAATTEGIAVVDCSLRLAQCNDAFTRLTGHAASAAIAAIFPEASYGVAQTLTAITSAIKHGQPTPLIECALGPIGAVETRQVLVSVAPVTVPQGYHAVVVLRDVTELRALDRMKAQFLQMISHEVRTPLHALNGYLDLTLSHTSHPLAPRQVELLQRARSCSRHLTARVKDLLLLADADTGFWEIDFDIVDIRRVIDEASAEVALLAEEHHVTIHQTIPTSLPFFWGDDERLEQMARNLLGNAIKFSPRGGHVRVEALVHAGALELRFVDAGCGIATEHLPLIFERYYQVPSAQGERRKKGQGLGLAIVKMIVERHGGWMQVLSTPGQGSIFVAHLPLRPVGTALEQVSDMPGASR